MAELQTKDIPFVSIYVSDKGWGKTQDMYIMENGQPKLYAEFVMCVIQDRQGSVVDVLGVDLTEEKKYRNCFL